MLTCCIKNYEVIRCKQNKNNKLIYYGSYLILYLVSVWDPKILVRLDKFVRIDKRVTAE